MFHVCGYTGLALAVFLSMSLVMIRGLSPFVMAGVVITAVLTFLGLAMVTKIITGEEYLTYFHHEIAIFSISALCLGLLGQPVLAYLDITMLGVGAFLMCGRIGCLMVGCCHGRPHDWGVCYRQEHVKAGFAHYLDGVRLFPIQAVESLFVGFIVLVGSWFVVSGQPHGVAFSWYIVAYDIGRFTFEFVRGDVDRPYFAGFSESQWISLFLTAGVVLAEWAGILPWQIWHGVAAVGLAAIMIGLRFHRQKHPAENQLLSPFHIEEVALALNRTLTNPKKGVAPLQKTSLGVCISSGLIDHPSGPIKQYSFSSTNGTVNSKTAPILARLVLQLRHPVGANELIASQNDVFHLLVRSGKEQWQNEV